MARSISIHRRRLNLVDLFVRQRPGVIGFRFSAGTNFDAAATAFQDVPIQGTKSPSVPDNQGFDSGQFKGLTRFRFDPSDYVATAAALVDTNPFYLNIAPITSAGVGSAEAYHLILPFSDAPQRSVMLSGNAPNKADLAHALELQLPMLCNNWEFQVNGGAAMFLAFEPTGAEWQIDPIAGNFTNFAKVYPNVSQLFFRGNGGATAFTAILTERNNPIA
jgi:hypothetical protein